MASLWGPSFLFIKLVIEEFPPISAAALRVSIAALFLYLILKFKNRKLIALGPLWKHFLVMGLVSNAIPFCLFCWGEMYIDSSLAALINGSPPIFTAILAHFFLRDEPLNWHKGIGILLGIGGLLILFLPNLSGGVYGDAGGILAIILATFCYAVGFVYGKIKLKGLPPLVAPASQLIMASLVLIPTSLIVERPFDMAVPSWTSISALCALGIFGTGIAFIVYYKVLETAGAMALSMVSYLLPLVGMVLGVLFLNESLTWNGIFGGFLILAAMMLVNGLFKIRPSVAADQR